jgi:hypothetical protein
MPTKLIINCATGEETIVELTAEEIAQRETDAAAYALKKAEQDAAAEAAAEAKASGLTKLMALGLTEAEANALVK